MVKVNMVFDSEKKHSYRYNAGVQDGNVESPISTLYISKWVFENKAPKEITVEVEEVK